VPDLCDFRGIPPKYLEAEVHQVVLVEQEQEDIDRNQYQQTDDIGEDEEGPSQSASFSKSLGKSLLQPFHLCLKADAGHALDESLQVFEVLPPSFLQTGKIIG